MVFLIFDLDGTIADSLKTNLNMLNRLALKYGFKEIDAKGLREKEIGEVFKEANVPLLKLPSIIEEALILAAQENLKPIKGMPEVLAKLKEKYNLGIITANTKENAERFLRDNNLEIFDFVHSSSLFTKDKAIMQVMKNFNIFEAYYIGDEVRDIEAARKAGIKSIAVTWGYNSKKLLVKHGADLLVEKPGELPKVLS